MLTIAMALCMRVTIVVVSASGLLTAVNMPRYCGTRVPSMAMIKFNGWVTVHLVVVSKEITQMSSPQGTMVESCGIH